MKHISWQIILGISLVILSAFVYFLHFLFFRDVHHIFIYLVGDIAFVFIEVLLVTLIIHRLLGEREKRVMLEKMNMVIGTFFSEVGTHLLAKIFRWNPESHKLAENFSQINDFTERKFELTSKGIKTYTCGVKPNIEDLSFLKNYLASKRDFLLRLLENPNLLEHDTFTNLLWAVFHLADELSHRKNLSRVSDNDRLHLAGDITRVYRLLISEWLDYMKHLKHTYPYLFSLAVRTNPFDEKALAEIE
jgi:hypothetical protein